MTKQKITLSAKVEPWIDAVVSASADEREVSKSVIVRDLIRDAVAEDHPLLEVTDDDKSLAESGRNIWKSENDLRRKASNFRRKAYRETGELWTDSVRPERVRDYIESGWMENAEIYAERFGYDDPDFLEAMLTWYAENYPPDDNTIWPDKRRFDKMAERLEGGDE